MAADAPTVRPMVPADCAPAARLHTDVLSMEFVSRFGDGFMSRYYLAWLESPGGVALVAAGADGALAGVLLGAVDPPAHTAAMVRKHGVALGARMLAAAARRPALAKELAVTRGARYVRGLGRIVLRPLLGRRAAPAAALEAREPVGEITHVLVGPDQQGRGIGRALLAAAEEEARRAGVTRLVLVTPPEQAARRFYERLGWLEDGTVTSRSGEDFVRYRHEL